MSDLRLDALAARLADAGFDVCAPFATSAYDALRPAGFAPLTPPGTGDALAVLVGNTRALWPKLRAALAADPALAGSTDPLDAYTERTVGGAVAEAFGGQVVRVAHAHDDGAGRVAMVCAAEAAGVAQRGPTGLAVHGVFGPWWALRAVAVLDLAPPRAPRPAARPCDGCPAPCRPPARAVERPRAAWDGDGRAFARAHMDALVAMRAACPVGAAHRYGPDQLRYHYLHDRPLLVPDRG